jgi:hypothetical protein
VARAPRTAGGVERIKLCTEALDVCGAHELEAREHADDELETVDTVAVQVERKDRVRVDAPEELSAALELLTALRAQRVELREQRGEHRDRDEDVDEGRHLARVRRDPHVAVADGRRGDLPRGWGAYAWRGDLT